MPKRIALLALALCLLVSFVGCDIEEEQKEQFLAIHPSNGAVDNSGEVTTESVQPTELKFEYSKQTAPHELRSGKLEFTISNPRVITHKDDMPGGDFSEAVATIWSNGNVTEYVCYSKRFPSFIREDGSFVEGVKLIVVDVTVTNIDAEMLTQKDADAEGKGGGDYTDPYIFRADHLIDFVDTGESAGAISVFGSDGDSGNYVMISDSYFSLLNSYEEHPFAFRLEPGEAITYSFGIVVGNERDGSDRDLSTIAVRIASSKYVGGEASDIYYVSLGLGGE